MPPVSRRRFVMAGSALAALATGLANSEAHAADEGFMAASSAPHGGHDGHPARGPGLQDIYALCEVTGGGEKVYGIAVEYDAAINPSTLSLNTYTASILPAARDGFAGMPPGGPHDTDPNAASPAPRHRAAIAIYTSEQPALRADRRNVPGRYVIIEFAHDPDLSLPSTDSDGVTITQDKDIASITGTLFAASANVWSNAGHRGNNTIIRGVDAWEQSHWWWDDSRATSLEYSIYLPKSFLEPGGEKKSYPLLLAVTHSGTSYDGTCAQTLTEQCIASIWSLPEDQARHECVIITPRYERTTMNDYWEHTPDVENTFRLVESLLGNTWNYGNPNLDDRRDKVLKIDRSRVYCTGWSMGAMTSLWLMAKHPETFAAGLIIAGQQRPQDVVPLAHQKLLIITGARDDKATPWTGKCLPVWEQAGASIVRPANLDPALIFPIENQQKLTGQIDSSLKREANITFLTFDDVDHMGSARKFFHIQAARDWLFRQIRA